MANDMQQIQLRKGGAVYVFNYGPNDSTELVYSMVGQAFGNKHEILYHGPSMFDFFDASVLAYKMLKFETNNREITDTHAQLYDATLFAVSCALSASKAEKQNLEMMIKRVGSDDFFDVNEIKVEQAKRIDILCNYIVPYLKEYVGRLEKWAA